jgi:glycosyltransferase involved in cell wall biosynthesis
MRAAIYNPYLDTLGGGERYTMGVARALMAKNFLVDVEWKDTKIKDKLEKRFDIDLEKINFIKSINRGDDYDLCFWVSDGSVPLLRAHKNFLHFQVPFQNVNGKSLLNKMKFFRIDKVICNSYFTKKAIDKEYAVEDKSMVIYPPVDVDKFKPKRKENLIISIARFSQAMQAKRQDVLIKAFKKLCNSGVKNWRLVLAGGVEVGVGGYLGRLKRKAGNYPIEIIESPQFKLLKELYGKAKIFWSASGFGVDWRRKPEKVEHFGITVVEAMAAGAIPIIFSAGGHKEIVTDDETGFLWQDTHQLLTKTREIIKNKDLFMLMSGRAQKRSLDFGYEEFEKQIWSLL